jgi:hypothetical protein
MTVDKWFDATAQVWRTRPDDFEAESPGEMAQGAWTYIERLPPRWTASPR